jgi:hypothetical protein
MPAKAIIDIEVNDGAFKQFQDLFKKYKEQLEGSVEDWGQVSKSMTDSQTIAAAMGAAIMAQTDMLREHLKVEKETAEVEKQRLTTWQSIVSHTKNYVGDLITGTRIMSRWLGLGGLGLGLGAGLLGLGGLWGLETLAGNASSGRRRAMGLGSSYGGQTAFGIDFGRAIDPNFLESVGQARGDVSQQAGLYGLGFNQQQIVTEETSQFSVDLLRRAKQLADSTNPTMYGNIIQARGLDNLFTSEDFRRLHSMSWEEFNTQAKNYGKDTGVFNLPPNVLREWTDFQTQLSRAGTKIETVLIDGLSGLTTPLSQLSDSLSDTIKALMKSQDVKDLMVEISKGLEQFAKYVATPQFAKDVKQFAEDVGVLTKGVASALQWIAGWLGEQHNVSAQDKADPASQGVDITGAGRANPPVTPGQAKFNRWANFFFAHGETEEAKTHAAAIRQIAAANGINPDIAVRNSSREGLRDFYGDYNKASGQYTSFGDFQLHMDARGHALGNLFQKQTGLDPSDQKNWKVEDEWYLNYARTHGWWDLTSARGDPRFQGIDRGHVVKLKIQNDTGGTVVPQVNQAAQ